MGRKILFITTDQQRYDCARLQRRRRSPARRWSTRSRPTGINYQRAYNQNTVCMPARSTMLTGQYVRTHGVVANGVPLPDRRAERRRATCREGAATAPRCSARPTSSPASTRKHQCEENAPRRDAATSARGAGFEHVDPGRCTLRRLRRRRAVVRSQHYGTWLAGAPPRAHRRASPRCCRPRAAATPARPRRRTTRSRASGTTPTGSPIARSRSSTRSTDDDDWFCWMSFPDPHHPWDPPESELHRVAWRDLDLPPGHPGLGRGDPRGARARSRRTGSAWWKGTWTNREGGPATLRPGAR